MAPLPRPTAQPASIERDADFLRHGGRLSAAERAWPDAPRPWIDLSTGVSPFSYPAPRASDAARRRLPDPERIEQLEAVAATAFGVADARRVVALAGAEAALRLLPVVLDAKSVAIDETTYGGHAEAWRAAGAAVLPRRQGGSSAEAVVVVNPNNPDGRVTEPEHLLRIADGLRARGGWLIVDESFVEATPGLSVAAAAHPAIVALRSFGKIYGLAGLRLGFLVAHPDVADRVRRRIGDWPISADALAAGLAAYGDPDWLDRTRDRLARAGGRLDAELDEAGFERVGGTMLFRLVRAPDARVRFARLCAQGVLTRPFADDATLLRFGVPHPSARTRVAQALRTLR